MTRNIFIDWHAVRLVPETKGDEDPDEYGAPAMVWQGELPEVLGETILVCSEGRSGCLFLNWDVFDADFLTFCEQDSERVRYWARLQWRECRPGEKPLLSLDWHSFRVRPKAKHPQVREAWRHCDDSHVWIGKRPPWLDCLLVALDDGRLIYDDTFDPDGFEISPPDKVRYWALMEAEENEP